MPYCLDNLLWLVAVLVTISVSMTVTANAMCTPNTCMNGYCSSGSKCTCLHGYTKDPNGRCIQFDRCTSGTCQNGFCSSVTFLCTCRDGFFKDPNGNCARTEPCTIDSCKNGICSQGGHCYCRTGYFKSPNGKCIAVALCTPAYCRNGVCDPRTQECICNTGYTKSANGQCIGFGSCQLTCKNGQCAKLMNLQEVCYCNQGFQRKGNSCELANPGESCQAMCKNGQCKRLLDMQEICFCDPGFQRDAKTPNTCTQPGGGGEAEQELEPEMGQQTTTTVPPTIAQYRPFNPRGGNQLVLRSYSAFNPRGVNPLIAQPYRVMNPGVAQPLTTPLPYTQVVMPQPNQQVFDYSAGKEMDSAQSSNVYDAMERRLMTLYLRLLSVRKILETLS